MTASLPVEVRHLVERTRAVCLDVVAPAADRIDSDGEWPREGLQALTDAGLAGLTVPRAYGGLGQGLLGLAAVAETIGQACASTGMCFGMHCVGAAVIAAKATPHHVERYLEPIARGEHLTTLALSETGSGAHFFLPRTALERAGDDYIVTGQKQFITNGGQADSYVLSTGVPEESLEGEFSCLIVDADADGLRWGAPWRGFGMHGNSSRGLELERVRVPTANLLGEEGDQVWYVFEVVAPYFLTAMAGVYLGIAQAALDETIQHMKRRRYAHSGQALADIDLLQHRVGQLWTGVEKSRLLLHHAARLGDLGSPEALTAVLASKADIAHTAVHTANEALTLCGGMAYRDNSVLTRHLRDARASHVMSPTTDLLTLWTGRSALGLPLI